MENKKANANQSGVKLLKLLECIVQKEEPQRLLDLARELNMNTSTALRFVTTLVNEGYVDQEPETQRYYPTYKICALANKLNVRMDIRDLAKPYMEQLTKIFGESVTMAVERNMTSVYIEVLRDTNQTLMAVQSIGNAVPMHCTGNGKVLLLNYSEEEIDQLIQVKGLPRYTNQTITTKEQLLKELDAIRKRGYAYDEEEMERGMRCVAFPIYDSTERVVAGISVTGSANRLTDEWIAPRLESFRMIARKISKKLGYRIFT